MSNSFFIEAQKKFGWDDETMEFVMWELTCFPFGTKERVLEQMQEYADAPDKNAFINKQEEDMMAAMESCKKRVAEAEMLEAVAAEIKK